MAISIEHNADLLAISRETVTLTDVMSDLGGLIEVLFVVAAFIVEILNYQHLETILATKLYREDNPADPSDPLPLTPPKSGYISEFFYDFFRIRCRCCCK